MRCTLCQGKGHGIDRHGSVETCNHCLGSTQEPTETEILERGAPRYKLHHRHPVIGENFKLLVDNDAVIFGDETATIDDLLSLDSRSWWVPVSDKLIYQVVGELGRQEPNRVFRRRVVDLD